MTEQEETELLEYVHALECVLIDGAGVPDGVMARLVGELRRRFAPTVSGCLYDWEGSDGR